MAEKVYVDLSEFVANPLSTGIQRVATELCMRWPPDVEIVPACIRGGRMLGLGNQYAAKLLEYFSLPSGVRGEFAARLRNDTLNAPGDLIPRPFDAPVLIPEVTYDPERIAFYRDLCAADRAMCFFIVFDLLPLTHPEYFYFDAQLTHEIISAYFRLIRLAEHVAFISDACKRDYFERLRRTPAGSNPVLLLGADGLSPTRVDPQPRSGSTLRFSSLGTVEPRKNHVTILRAFRRALASGLDIELTFLGGVGWIAPEVLREIQQAAEATTRFRFLQNPSDEQIRREVLASAATVYASSSEGYGLPPVESLWLGVPVIASDVPSLERIGGAGVHRLESVNEEELLRAFQCFGDHEYTNRKAAEAGQAKLSTWNNFASQTVDWVIGRSQ